MTDILKDCKYLLELLDKEYPGQKNYSGPIRNIYITVTKIIEDANTNNLRQHYRLGSFVRPYIDDTGDYLADSEILIYIDKVENDVSRYFEDGRR